MKSPRPQFEVRLVLTLVVFAGLASTQVSITPQNDQAALLDTIAKGNFDYINQRSAPTIPCTRFGDKNLNLSGCRKSCECDLNGSKTTTCDKITGRCACKIGYTGIRCNQCSLGYYDYINDYNSSKLTSIDSSIVSRIGANGKYCIECGGCFNRWHRNIVSLKEHSVIIIKKTHEMSYNLTSSFTINANFDNNFQENGNVVHFNELDNKISRIGERVLTNKLSSDKINLLAHELNSTLYNLNETRVELLDQQVNYKRFRAELVELNYKVQLQGEILDGLNHLVDEKFRREQLQIQEFIPRGAYKLVLNQRNRSRLALLNAIEIENSFYANFKNLIERVSTEFNSSIEYKQQLDKIGSRILNELLKIHSLNTTTLNSYNFDQPIQSLIGNHISSESFIKVIRNDPSSLIKTAKFTVDEVIQIFEDYQSNAENRAADLLASKQMIEDSRKIANQTSHNLDGFNSTILALLNLVEQFDQNHVSTAPNFVQMIENCTQMTRTYLDRIEAKWSSCQTELNRLLQTHSNSLSHQLFNISSVMKLILERNPLQYNNFDEDSMNILNMKLELKNLDDNLTHSKDIMQFVAGLRRDIWSNLDQSKAITTKIEIDGYKLNCSVVELENELDNIRNNFNQMQMARVETKSSPIGFPKFLLDRHKQLEIKLMEHRINSKTLLESTTTNLIRDNHENKELIAQVADKFREITIFSQILNSNDSKPQSILIGDNLTDLTRRRAEKLRDQRRASNLLLELKQISKYLYSLLGQIPTLSGEFKDNEMIIDVQLDIIDELDREMTHINHDIEEKLKFYEKNNCQESIDL